MSVTIENYACAFGRRRLSQAAVVAAGWVAPRGWPWSSVLDVDEDALTLALAAARVLPDGATPTSVALASITLPYRRRVQAGFLAEALCAAPGVFVSEHTTSARAGTEAFVVNVLRCRATGASTLTVAAERGSDPSDSVDISAAAAAFRIGPDGDVATVEAMSHSSSEDPGLDFVVAGEWTRRDVGVPDYSAAAYVASLRQAFDSISDELGAAADAFTAVILAGVTPDLARKGASALGLKRTQWETLLPYSLAGDMGAAGALVGLAAALDGAASEDRILVLSYGAGSATDAIALVAGPGCGRGAVASATAGMTDVDLPSFVRLRGGQ